MKNHKPVTAYYVSAAKVAEYILHVDGEIDLRDSAIISEIIADYGNDKLVQLEFSNDEIVYRINTDVDHSTENEKFIAALQGMEGVVTSVTIDLIQTTVTTNQEYFNMSANTNTNAAAMPEVDFKKAIVEAALKQMESMNLDPEAKANLEQVLKGIAQPEVKQPAQEPAKEAAPDSAQSAKDADAPKASAETTAASTAQPVEDESIFTWKNAATAAKYVAGAVIVAGAVYLAVNHFSIGNSTGSDTLE